MSVKIEECSSDGEFMSTDYLKSKIQGDHILPTRSKEIYQRAYNDFISWCISNNVNNCSEKTLLEYFAAKSKILKASSMVTVYSMLKSTLQLYHKTDISKFSKLLAYLKIKSNGHSPKRTKILTKNQVLAFLTEAPDEKYLMVKVALIFGIAGGRSRELTDLKVDDIQDLGTSLLVIIRESDSHIKRSYNIFNDKGWPIDFLDIFRKYASLRPKNIEHRRFFIYYDQGKCSRQVVGKNTFGQLPKKIANFLNLPDPGAYTGHCFRYCSASFKRTNDAISSNDPHEHLSVIKDLPTLEKELHSSIKIEQDNDDSSYDFERLDMPEEDRYVEISSLKKQQTENLSKQEKINISDIKNSDEISVYGELLMIKLRKMDTATRIMVCNKIDNLISQTEMALLNKSLPEIQSTSSSQ
ncbi:uncharacterized protein LOC130895521 [Diorhabda carinulata]|uniref:uncharacterized protein LOC130895521 n=1 Tax=Diorhabda carinulata TaxID=1163345 RepID=UPI0025A10697|nr:uncharacterized protein LOC130895521 [Diorhabda carinulata]